MIFQNRTSAGRLLGERLQFLSVQKPIILALPRGGVPVGYEIAKQLKAPLDVLVVRKIGSPPNPEYGIGAITEDGSYWINTQSARAVEAGPTEIERIASEEFAEVTRRVEQYRGSRPLPSLQGRTVIVTDDGLATGVTARVACRYLKAHGAKKVILAVPVCSAKTADTLRSAEIADEIICFESSDLFYAVGQFYQDFNPILDEEVVSLLAQARSAKNVRSDT